MTGRALRGSPRPGGMVIALGYAAAFACRSFHSTFMIASPVAGLLNTIGVGMREGYGHDADYENVGRGSLYAIAVVVPGVLAWLILWQLGWISAIVALGIAVLTIYLYRYGSGGHVSTAGAVAITVIASVTVILALVASFIFDAVISFLSGNAFDIAVLGDPVFWDWFWSVHMQSPGVLNAWSWNLTLALALSAVGLVPPLLGLVAGQGASAKVVSFLMPLGIAATALGLAVFVASDAVPPATVDMPVAGTCATDAALTGRVVSDGFHTISCDAPHATEVVATLTLPVSPEEAAAPYPGEDLVSQRAFAACAPAWAEYVGVPQETSSLSYSATYPSAAHWKINVFDVVCAVSDPGGMFVGSLRGSGR